jgi:hypothetical protein
VVTRLSGSWSEDELRSQGVEDSDHVITSTTPNLRNAIWAELDGPADIIFFWWGLSGFSRAKDLMLLCPHAQLVVCVDTFPNASWIASEIREIVYSLAHTREIAALVVVSDEMQRSIRHRIPSLRLKPTLVITQPLPAIAHARPDAVIDNGASASVQHPHLVFTGRSDLLRGTDHRMRKDGLIDMLRDYLRTGAEIDVQRPIDESEAEALQKEGFGFYPHFSGSEMLDGSFASYLGRYDGQIVTYRIHNGTVKRRVSGALSTRWAFGLASPAPLVVPLEADFAKSFFSHYEVGWAVPSPEVAVRYISTRGARARENWVEHHHRWTAEGLSSRLLDFLGSLSPFT